MPVVPSYDMIAVIEYILFSSLRKAAILMAYLDASILQSTLRTCSYPPLSNLKHSFIASLSQDAFPSSHQILQTPPRIPPTAIPQDMIFQLLARSSIQCCTASTVPEDGSPHLPRDRSVKQVRIVRPTVAVQVAEEAVPGSVSRLRQCSMGVPDAVVDVGGIEAATVDGLYGRFGVKALI